MSIDLAARIRFGLPVHYTHCESVQPGPGVCDCTATADIEALLRRAEADALDVAWLMRRAGIR